MRYGLILLSCLVCFTLQGTAFDLQDPQDVATSEGLPSSIVNESVCVVSGAYTDSVTDIVIPGPESLVIHRQYDSHFHPLLGHPWFESQSERLILSEAIHKEVPSHHEPVLVVTHMQPSGAQLNYIFPKDKMKSHKNSYSFQLKVPKGLTNGATQLSGQTNLKNQKVNYYPKDEKAVVTTGAGDRITFMNGGKRNDEKWESYIRKKEEKVNGSLYTYSEKEGVRKIQCQNAKTLQIYSYVKSQFTHTDSDHPTRIDKTSDGRTFNYQYKRHKYKIVEPFQDMTNTRSMWRLYLSKVDHPYAPKEEYRYEEKENSKELHLVYKKRPKGRFLKTEYYRDGTNVISSQLGNIHIKDKDDYRLDRVKKQQAPVGTTDKAITTHRFVYDAKVKENKERGYKEILEGTTDVYDAYHHRTCFAYDELHRLISITRYKGTSSYKRHCKEYFIWGKEGDKKGNLLGKIFKDGEQRVHHARYFNYDDRGNVLHNVLCGRLTGRPAPEIILDSSHQPVENGYEYSHKTFTYSDDGLNLPLTETDESGKTTYFKYIKGTNHLAAKFIAYHGSIHLREFYFYDDNYVLIRKIADDGKLWHVEELTGVTERHFTHITPRQTAPFGLPEKIEESCLDFSKGQEKLIRSSVCHYSTVGKKIKEDLYDANRQFSHSLTWEYDDHGNLLQETNALGPVTIKKYDENDNLIFQQEAGSSFYIQNSYDFSNRLISQEEVHANGERFVTTHLYDYLGNCVATTDPYGNETQFVFDDFGHVIRTEYSAFANEEGRLVSPILSQTYDVAGNAISFTDAKGLQTHLEYNIRGQPTKVTYPDGSTESKVYQLDGQLAEKIEKTGSKIVYKRDLFGRIIEEIYYNSEGHLVKKIQQIYNALHLLQTIDEEGVSTHYSYTPEGYLEWVRKEDHLQQNLYDAKGRQVEIREWFGHELHEYRATVKAYDLLDQVIEERLQDSQGNILHLACYQYDAQGNRTLAQVGEQKTWTEYNAHRNPIKITNALGHVTHTVYNTQFINGYGQRVLQTTTTDPLGYQIIDTYDTANHLVETIRKNPLGAKISCQAILYDIKGNKRAVKEEVIQEEKVTSTITTLYEYAEDDQLITLIEAAGTPEQKITRSTYNQQRRKASTIKPDGTCLLYEYDAWGRVQFLRSSDDSIAYAYKYDLKDQVIQVMDLNTRQVTERVYNKMGRLDKEILANGLELTYTYDRSGRAQVIELPDQTGIQYVYNAVDLKEIHRIKEGKRLYSHSDEQHTLAGNITKATLAGDNGEINYRYDALNRCVSMQTNQMDQAIPEEGFDAAGNLLKVEQNDQSYTFDYDDYYQVKSEKGHAQHEYRFDSLGNRIIKDSETYAHNALNQITHKGKELFTYDLNGNLTCHQKGEKKTCYTYDALDRLIGVAKDGKSVSYLYDAFNRRIIKRQGEKPDQLFIYQGQEEIGCWVEDALQELRLLAKNKYQPTAAIEIKGEAYIPLYDFVGNVICLKDIKGKIIEKYRYTAFGEVEVLNSENEILSKSKIDNPWQYASKRLDKETGLVAFGLRYYNPELGRWINPDPAGFVDGSNLYAYVRNNPLLYKDSFGLFSTLASGIYGSPFVHNFHNKIGEAISTIRFGLEKLGCSFDCEVQNREIEDALEAKHNFRCQQGEENIPPFERTALYSLNNGFINPDTNQPFNLKQSDSKLILYMNGIQNRFKDFSKTLSYMGTMSDYNIEGIHSASHGLYSDLKCYFNALYCNVGYEEVEFLHQRWSLFFSICGPEATILQKAHSRGCVYVRNALMSFPPDLRNRIRVVAFAPGGFIDPKLCKSVVHYVSKGDFIPLWDVVGRERCKDTIVELDPHPSESQTSDHGIMSKTYQPWMFFELDRYNNDLY